MHPFFRDTVVLNFNGSGSNLKSEHGSGYKESALVDFSPQIFFLSQKGFKHLKLSLSNVIACVISLLQKNKELRRDSQLCFYFDTLILKYIYITDLNTSHIEYMDSNLTEHV